jgi:ferredoxin
MPAKVDKDLCAGCEACVEVCPKKAISMVNDVAHVDEKKCDECGACVDECPNGAISLDTD